ncbi:chemotaxis regulator CheZ [mine drainage metagenome]|uniref:Protein phosphatase CheZ n=1 Tax=mine drainage metagenome TaxID=410659 RepID=A0A1J5RZH3_9ZZZZ
MAKPIKFDESGDSEDLQSLFDSIAGGAAPAAVALVETNPANDASGDSDELQALFDSVAAESPAAATAERPSEGDEVFNRIGRMTRELHDSLRQLGYDKMLGDTAKAIPDARQRLAYIAQMTEQAASRVLNATDIAKPIQDDLQRQSETLGKRWEKVFTNQLSVDEFKALAGDTHGFLRQVPAQTRATSEQLTEIMMAQDFQDLTGQVIKKVVDMAQALEAQLLSLLVEAMPQELRAETPPGLLNGPVINAQGRGDVVSSQAQVDDLLESLGF